MFLILDFAPQVHKCQQVYFDYREIGVRTDKSIIRLCNSAECQFRYDINS